jgi:hypothetical protein
MDARWEDGIHRRWQEKQVALEMLDKESSTPLNTSVVDPIVSLMDNVISPHSSMLALR